jgi:hemerythrin-like domain-containing protein
VTTPPDAPADTRMMRIVHQALRRDLARTRDVLASDPALPPDQQAAIAGHLAWMMGFLRAHHETEDAHLYPLILTRDPGAAGLVEEMHADHERIAARIGDLETAAAAVGATASDADLRELARSVDRLNDVLLPHLQREEDDVMPVVSSAITHAEWSAIEQEYNVKPKSFVELGREGHWIIDGASPEDRAAVLSLMPAVPRFVLVHGFAGAYRRRAAACWGQPAEHRRVQKTGRCTVRVDADINDVWDVVRDVTRVGEWSHECVGATWLGSARTAVPGARFRGHNRAGLFRWGRVCEVISADRFEFVWRTVPTALYPDSTEWAIRLRPVPDGTEIEQTFRVLRAPKVLDPVYATMIPTHRNRTAALAADLRRLGDVAATCVRRDGRVRDRETEGVRA